MKNKLLSGSRKSVFLLFVLGVALFSLNYWMACLRQYSSNFDASESGALFGEDAMEVLVHGRQLADFGRISTFVWPGYMWHGTVKETLLYCPTLIFGFHEQIPVVMAALAGTFIPWAAFFLMRRMFGQQAAIIGLLLCGAFDVFVAQNVFMLAFPFDVQVALSLGLALFTLEWAERARDGQQPGALFCVGMGVLAGILLYAHLVALPVLLASGLFLILSVGRRLFTWRLLAVALGGVLGSARLWLYWLKYVPLSAFVSLDSQRSERLSWSQYLWGGDGFFAYLFSPSGNPFVRWITGFVFALTVVFVFWRMGRFLVAKHRTMWTEGWRQGFPLPLFAYGVILFPCYMLFMYRLSGVARFGGPVHNYSVELRFWLMMAMAAWLGWLWRRQRHLSLGLTGVLVLFLYGDLLIHFPRPTPRLLRLYADYRADADQLIQEKKQPLLYVQGMNGHLYPYLAPAPLLSADGLWNLGLLDPVAAVERHPCPSVLADLDAGVLGSNAWKTLPLRTATVHYDFNMPSAGRWVSPTSWVWSIGEQPFERGGVLCDGNLATAWSQSRSSDVPRLTWTVRFDQPRTICRIVLMALCENGSWWPSTYSRFKTHFTRRISPVESLPSNLCLEGLMADTGKWQLLVKKAGDPDFFWDGGRLFFDARERCRLDIRFPPCNLIALRMVEERTGAQRWRKVSELAVFERDDTVKPSREDERRLWSRLRALAPHRLYADRYVSAQVSAMMSPVAVWQPSVLKPPCYLENYQTDWPWFTSLEPLETDHSVIVADSAWAPAIEHVLTTEELVFSRESFGAWTLYCFGVDQALRGKRSGLVWNGMCLGAFPPKSAARGWLEEAWRTRREGETNRSVRALERALSTYPAYYEAGRLLHEWNGGVSGGQEWLRNAPPAHPFARPIRFLNGAEVLAVEASPAQAKRNSLLELRFYWRIPSHWPGAMDRPILFCHLRNGSYSVNADRKLLSGHSDTDLLDTAPEGWSMDRFEVLLPRHAPGGRYRLEFGLLAGSGERVPVKYSDPSVRVDRRSAVWMQPFEVLP